MCDFAETRALLLRRWVGIEGIAGPLSVGRLKGSLGLLVEEERGALGQGRWSFREDGGWRITVPHRQEEGWPWANAWLHEAGHGFTHTEGRSEQTEDEDAELFRLAFILPRHMLRAVCRDSSEAVAEMAYCAGMTPAQLCNRYEWCLSNPAPILSLPESWSAWWELKMVRRHNTYHEGLLLRSPQGEEWVWYCPNTDDRERRKAELDVRLRTFTTAEFTTLCQPNRLLEEDVYLTREFDPRQFVPYTPQMAGALAKAA